jgi:hypothetical protein
LSITAGKVVRLRQTAAARGILWLLYQAGGADRLFDLSVWDVADFVNIGNCESCGLS